MDSSHDDPVVREIDVFFNDQLGENLLLLQYPLRPYWRPYEELEHCENFEIRPKNMMVRMDVPLPHSDAVNPQAQFNVSRLSLTSERIPAKAAYCAGLLTAQGTQLHLTPVREILQMRPSFSYLNEAQIVRRVNDDGEEVEESEDVTARNAMSAAQRAAAARWEEQQRAAAITEPYVSCRWSGEAAASSIAKLSMLKLTQSQMEAASITVTADRLLAKIAPERPPSRQPQTTVPGASTAAIANPSSRQQLLSTRALAHKKTAEVVEACMCVMQIMTFRQIMGMLSKTVQVNLIRQRIPPNATPQQTAEAHQQVLEEIRVEAIRALSDCAVLLNGIWVVRSKYVVRPELVAFRDYMLLLFRNASYVSRKFFADATGLPPHIVRELLSAVCANTSRGWRLRLPGDQEFLAQHADTVREFDNWWNQHTSQIQQDMIRQRAERTERTVSEELVGGHYVGSRLISEAGTSTLPSGVMTPVIGATPFESGGPAPDMLAVAARKAMEQRAAMAISSYVSSDSSFGEPPVAATPGAINMLRMADQNPLTPAAGLVPGRGLFSEQVASLLCDCLANGVQPRDELLRYVTEQSPVPTDEETLEDTLRSVSRHVRNDFYCLASTPVAEDNIALNALADLFGAEDSVSFDEVLFLLQRNLSGTAQLTARQLNLLAQRWVSYFANHSVNNRWVFKGCSSI